MVTLLPQLTAKVMGMPYISFFCSSIVFHLPLKFQHICLLNLKCHSTASCLGKRQVNGLELDGLFGKFSCQFLGKEERASDVHVLFF